MSKRNEADVEVRLDSADLPVERESTTESDKSSKARSNNNSDRIILQIRKFKVVSPSSGRWRRPSRRWRRRIWRANV